MSKRARKGGEVGINGEMYDGGKFMPSTKLSKRSPSSKTPRSNRCTKPTHVLLVCDWCSFGATFRACICCGRRKPVAP